MQTEQRKLVVITSLGKKYSGMIDVPSATFRTTDLLNAANIFWKHPSLKCYDNAIFMRDVELSLDNNTVFKKYDHIQVKLDDIIYFYDEVEGLGNEIEKKRALTLVKQSNENAQAVNIITRQVCGSFYEITGLFFGLFRKKSKDKFIPSTEACIVEVFKKGGRWIQQSIHHTPNYIGVSNNHIESVTFSEWIVPQDSRLSVSPSNDPQPSPSIASMAS